MRTRALSVACLVFAGACRSGGSTAGSARPKPPSTREGAGSAGGEGCSPERAPCSGQATLLSGGRERRYRFHLPKPGGAKPGVVIALHGRGGDGAGFEVTTHIVRLADQEGFIAIVPDGFDKSWADARDVTEASKAHVDDVGFVSALVDEGTGALGGDAARVLVAGFSNGAMMTQSIGCQLAGKIAAIGFAEGTMPEAQAPSCAVEKAISVIGFHGTKDHVVPYAGGELHSALGGTVLGAEATAARWAALDGCKGAPVTTDEPDADPDDGTRVKRATYGGCANGVTVALFTIDGGDHKWPVGPEPGKKEKEGQSRDVDALLTMWTLASGAK